MCITSIEVDRLIGWTSVVAQMQERARPRSAPSWYTPNPRTNIVDFGGLDSSTILIQRGGILMSIGDLPES